jgi:hypothetical protein
VTEAEWQSTVTRKLGDIESRLAIIEATRGTVRIPPAAWGILWGILVTLLGAATTGAFLSGQFAAELASQQGQIASVSARLHEHEVLPGHSGVAERINAVKEQVERLERKSR